MSPASLPSFASPPLTEVVFGVVIESLDKMRSAHLGRLWGQFLDGFPKCEDLVPLAPIQLPRGEPDATVPVEFPRAWFLNRDETQIIQVQRDRFIFNWRKFPNDEKYPGYDVVRSCFSAHFAAFIKFVEQYNLGVVAPIQCELTYANHIAEGEGWTALEALDGLFPVFGYRSIELETPSLSNIHLRLAYSLPENAGVLNVNIVDALRIIDERRLIQMELIARTPRQKMGYENVLEWFDLARGHVVKAFESFTSGVVQRDYWGRKL